MIRSYLTIALRALRKRLEPTLINIIGLAAGLAVCLLIGLWVQHEISYDTFHPTADRTVRLASNVKLQGNLIRKADAPAPLAEVVAEEIPEAEAVTRFRHDPSATLHRGTRSVPNVSVAYADSNFFRVFSGFRLIAGTPETVLQGTNALVLTRTTAEQLFGQTDVVGRTVRLRGETWRVAGVMADVPETSHVTPGAVASLRIPEGFADNWTALIAYTYVTLQPGTSISAFEETLAATVRPHLAPQIEAVMGVSFEAFLETGSRWGFFAQPLTDIHLHSHLDEELQANGSMASVLAFSAIGLIILLLACINFMNLATARATERSVEVGVRKSLGADRLQLMGQFLGEGLLTVAVSGLLAFYAAGAALPVFNDLAGMTLRLNDLLAPTMLLAGLGIVVMVGLLAGGYPAFVLSRFSAPRVLKAGGRHSSGGQGRRLRQGLVVAQFAVSIALLMGTFVVQDQFAYVQSKRLGLDREQVVELKGADALGDQQDAFVQRIRRMPGVLAGGAGTPLFERVPEQAFMPEGAPSTAARPMKEFQVGAGFVETMGVDVVAGRTFDRSRRADSSAVLLNRSAVRALGWDAPVGRRLTTPGDSAATYRVIGVLDDFHYRSMHSPIRPAAFFLAESSESVYVRLDPDRTGPTLNGLKASWREASAEPFLYAFLDRTYAAAHDDMARVGRLVRLFAGLAVLIACLGLFGLATYTVQRRRKEISIRKALGATAAQVVGRLSTEFFRLVALAGVVAVPVAYLGMTRWLSTFAYHTPIRVTSILGAIILACTVAFLAIGVRAFQASQLDPARVLKEE